MNNDQPKKLKTEDRLQRYEFSKRIAQMIDKHESQQSLVIGLYGKWGEGKTSVMNFIKVELSSDTIVVNFNPWLFSDQGHLMQAFFNSIAFGLNKSITHTKEKIGKLLGDYGSAMGAVSKAAGISLDGLSLFGDKLRDISIEKLRERVDKIINESGKRIVVFIDDIDRLDVVEVQYIFKLVKLVGDFPRTAYVLAFDDEMVATALAPKYGNQDKINGYLFLEKIIQVPLKIPKATRKALRQYTIDLIDKVFRDYHVKMGEKEMASFMSGFEDCFVPHIENPRLGIRYANTLSFALPLLMGEVHVADLILVEGIKIFFPEAYDFLRANSSLFLTDTSKGGSMYNHDMTKDEIKKQLDQFLIIYPEKTRKPLLSLLQELFPQVFFVYRNFMTGDNAWREWYKNKRIASGKYFNRYFSYVVQEGDISDIYFNQLLAGLENTTVEVTDDIAELFETVEASDIIFKLRLWEEQLTANQSKSLSMILVKHAKQLPIEPLAFRSYTTHAEAAKMIAHLSLNISSKERLEFILRVLAACENMPFAMEINYWLFYKNEKAEEKIFNEEETSRLHEYLIEKFKIEINNGSVFDILPDMELWRMFLWWRKIDGKGLDELIVKELEKGITAAINFIKVFTPTITSYGNKGHEMFKSGFEETNFNSMTEVMNTSKIYELLTNGDFKPFDIKSEKNSGQDPLTDSELAGIFIEMYEKKLQEGRSS
ncbi:MAG: P-loop NTPase fold protein [Sphingobacteriales bacterium]